MHVLGIGSADEIPHLLRSELQGFAYISLKIFGEALGKQRTGGELLPVGGKNLDFLTIEEHEKTCPACVFPAFIDHYHSCKPNTQPLQAMGQFNEYLLELERPDNSGFDTPEKS